MEQCTYNCTCNVEQWGKQNRVELCIVETNRTTEYIKIQQKQNRINKTEWSSIEENTEQKRYIE